MIAAARKRFFPMSKSTTVQAPPEIFAPDSMDLNMIDVCSKQTTADDDVTKKATLKSRMLCPNVMS